MDEESVEAVDAQQCDFGQTNDAATRRSNSVELKLRTLSNDRFREGDFISYLALKNKKKKFTQ